MKREFETQLDTHATELVAGFEKSSKKLANSPIPADLRLELDNLIARFKERKQEVIASHSSQFARWMHEHAVNELALDGGHAVAAMENYFTANPPFKSAKIRNDIPDAMVYQQVVEIAKHGPLVFVCNDKKLAAAVIASSNVTHYTDLNGFVASSAIQAIIAQQEATDSATSLLERLKDFASTPLNDVIEYVSDHGGEKLAGTRFCSASIPGDDREAYIYMSGSLYDIELDWDGAAYHGDHVYLVPFAGEGRFNINYFVPKWDAHEVETRGGGYHYHNDYVMEADEEAALWVSGMLRIKIFDDYTPDDDLEEAIEALSIDSVNAPRLTEDRD